MRIDEVSLDRGGPAGADGHDAPGPGGPAPRRRASAVVAIATIGAVAGLVAGLVYFVWVARGPAPAAQPAPTTSTEVPVAPAPPVDLPREPLPPLSASDSYMRRVVALLSQNPTLARWLASDALVERTALAVEQAGDGRSPIQPFGFARPSSRTAVVTRGADTIIDPASHRRWDELTSAIVSIDPRQAAEVYAHVRPLFVETYRTMGHPDGNFDAALGRAGGRVLDTPVSQEPLVVEQRRGYLEHRDMELRALPGISRQLLLMGPSNVARLRDWTSRFLQAAGIAPR